MKSRTFYVVLILGVFFSSLIMAQFKETESNVFNPSSLLKQPAGLLDNLLSSSKFSMSHSYSVSYLSMGSQGFTQGLYLNTMNYRFSDPLLMQVRIGYLHQPFGRKGISENSNGTLFVQRAMLQYKPSNNFSIRIDYQSLPSSLMMSPYRRGW
jgi:hypothetical protein